MKLFKIHRTIRLQNKLAFYKAELINIEKYYNHLTVSPEDLDKYEFYCRNKINKIKSKLEKL